VNNDSVEDITLHVETRQYFLGQLKEEGIIKVIWIPGELNSSDMYTNNLIGAYLEKHANACVGYDTYMKG
jgi:hypothetical protein